MMELERVDYEHGAAALTGWLAKPAGTARAAIVIFPTIVNSNAAVERRAQMLADAGYLAMIADFYGEPVETFDAARPLSGTLQADPLFYRARLACGIEALRSHADVLDAVG